MQSAGEMRAAAPPGWNVRRASLADRFAGVTASLLMGSAIAAGSAAAGGFLLNQRFAADERARAIAETMAIAPADRFAEISRIATHLYPAAQFAVLDASGAPLMRGGGDAAYPRSDLALRALDRVKFGGGELRDESFIAPDAVQLIPDSSGRPGEPYVVVARAPAGQGGWIAAAGAAAVLLAGLSVAGLGTRWARRKFRRGVASLKAVAGAAHRIGGRDFDVHLDVKSGDEIEAAALAVNRMARRLGVDNARMARLAELDLVTGLANRATFVKSASDLIGNSEEASPMGALIICDLVRFRHLNESLGCKAADAVLAQVARRFEEAMRPAQMAGGVVARLGADEFALLAPGIGDDQGAERLMRAFIAAASEPIQVDARHVVLTASAGAVLYDGRERDIERLIGQAQSALKRGRAEKPGLGRIYSSGLDRRVGDVLAVEAAIRDAVARDRIVP